MAGVAGRSGRRPMPLAVAEANGAMQVNPGRFEGRVDKAEFLDSIPLGMPSPEVVGDAGMLECWTRFTREIAWLRESDRTIVEAASWCRAKLLAAMRGDMITVGMRTVRADIDDKTISLLLRLLSHMGATPTAVGKVVLPKSSEPAPAAAKKGSRYGDKMLTLRASTG
jgi:hypothetical protein